MGIPLAICLLAGPTPQSWAAPVETASTWVFECSNRQRYVARAEDNTLWLFAPGETHRLSEAVNESPGIYSSERVRISIDDQLASISERGQAVLNCRNNRRAAVWEHAKLGGADFRAVGNEPGWQLEIIASESMVLVTDYGAMTIEQALPEAEPDPAARSTRWNGTRFDLQVVGASCTDSMSGERFESTATVWLDERILRGCGRALH